MTMKIILQAGYETLLLTINGTELEVLNKIIHNMRAVKRDTLDSGEVLIPQGTLPGWELQVVKASTQILVQQEFDVKKAAEKRQSIYREAAKVLEAIKEEVPDYTKLVESLARQIYYAGDYGMDYSATNTFHDARVNEYGNLEITNPVHTFTIMMSGEEDPGDVVKTSAKNEE